MSEVRSSKNIPFLSEKVQAISPRHLQWWAFYALFLVSIIQTSLSSFLLLFVGSFFSVVLPKRKSSLVPGSLEFHHLARMENG